MNWLAIRCLFPSIQFQQHMFLVGKWRERAVRHPGRGDDRAHIRFGHPQRLTRNRGTQQALSRVCLTPRSFSAATPLRPTRNLSLTMVSLNR